MFYCFYFIFPSVMNYYHDQHVFILKQHYEILRNHIINIFYSVTFHKRVIQHGN